MLATLACTATPRGPTHVPKFPQALAEQHAPAWAAFELPLRPDGSVERDAVRTLGWEAFGASPTLFVALRNVAAGTRWDRQQSGGATDTNHVVLLLDGSGQALAHDAVPPSTRARVKAALVARRRALEALGATGPANTHTLDSAWMSIAGLRSGAPFLHDDVDGWQELEPRLRAVEERDGGLWVCRAARGTHQGQFVFLDAKRHVLAIERYILGE